MKSVFGWLPMKMNTAETGSSLVSPVITLRSLSVSTWFSPTTSSTTVFHANSIFGLAKRALLQDHAGAQLIAAVHDSRLRDVARGEDALVERRVAAADDDDRHGP